MGNTNSYYNRGTDFNPDELADGDSIEAEFDSIQRGMSSIEAALNQKVSLSEVSKLDAFAELKENIRAQLKIIATENGYNLVDGSFEEGGTLASATDVLWYQADGKYYSWFNGSAKTVVAGSTPATTGGIGAGAWVDRSDVTLRSELAPRIEDLSAQSFEALRRSYAEAGFTLVDGSFEEGGTLTSSSDVLLHKASGIAYSGPIGSVAARTDPTAAGSIGWIDRSASSITFTQPSAGAVRRTALEKMRDVVSVLDFGAKFDGVTDDTSAINAALSAGYKAVVTPCQGVAVISGLQIPSGVSLIGMGSTLLGSPTNKLNHLIAMSSDSLIKGITIDGNKGLRNSGAAIYVPSGTSNVSVRDCKISNSKGQAIYLAGTASNPVYDYDICGNTIISTDTTAQAILLEFASRGRVSDNRIDTAYHGVQWWGGYSNLSTSIGVSDITINGNSISNVMGGIWGSLGKNITVTGNVVRNCSDVGIDFEGCSHFTASGNTAKECVNGCYAVFFGCTFGTFTGNVAENMEATGSAFYATTNGSYINQYITLSGNMFHAKSVGVYADPNGGRSLSNSVISGNTIVMASGRGISIFENSDLLISSNHITTVGSGVGIGLEGVKASVVRGNSIYGFSDTSSDPANAGGIYMYRRSASWPALGNEVSGNRVSGYVYSCTDNPAVDLAQSLNFITANRLKNIYRATGAAYNGVISENIDIDNPLTSVTATSF